MDRVAAVSVPLNTAREKCWICGGINNKGFNAHPHCYDMYFTKRIIKTCRVCKRRINQRSNSILCEDCFGRR